MSRDDRFAGFAEKLERDLHFLAFSMYHDHKTGDEVMLAYRKMIAQRAYDLVQHTVGYSMEYLDECGKEISGSLGTRVLASIPDMRQWPEEASR